MNRFFLFFIVGILLITCGCGTPSKKIAKKQEITEQISSADIQNRSVLNKEQSSPVVPEKKTASQINNNLSNEKDISNHKYKRGISVLQKEELIKFKSEKRIALVIGNSTYKISPLKNPENDALAMSNVLKKLDFEVIVGTNLSQKEMKRLIYDFGIMIKNGGVGLFYYAGHGMQVNGRNYLIPTDAKIESENEVDIVSVRADEILAKMDDANNRLNIVILDACRNNPFARSFRSSTQGLVTMDSPSGTIIAYATAPGSVASDGPGDNGLYTNELIENMQIPNLKIEDMFKKVRTSVKFKTNEQQIPWESSSLEGDFYFSSSDLLLAREMEELSNRKKKLNIELKQIKEMEAAAKKAHKEQAELNAQLKKKEILAKLEAEHLRMEVLQKEKQRQEKLALLDKRKKIEQIAKKKKLEQHLAELEMDAERKRKALGTRAGVFNYEDTQQGMKEIDIKIKKIRENYLNEMVVAINTVMEPIKIEYEMAINIKKSEFETSEEHQQRIYSTLQKVYKEKQKKELDKTVNIFRKNYFDQISPFLSELKALSDRDFPFSYNQLTFQLLQYDAKANAYPITIKVNSDVSPEIRIKTVIPMARDKARIFSQHYNKEILRATLSGNFQTPEYFRIKKATVINDATQEVIDLFATPFIDLGEGILLDTKTQKLWHHPGKSLTWGQANTWSKTKPYNGIYGWRLSSPEELKVFASTIKTGAPGADVLEKLLLAGSNWKWTSDRRTGPYRNGNLWKGGNFDNPMYGGSSNRPFVCVRSSKTKSINEETKERYKFLLSPFIDLGEGILLDTKTQKLWHHPGKSLTWGQANTWSKTKPYNGIYGWRLPSPEELKVFASTIKTGATGADVLEKLLLAGSNWKWTSDRRTGPYRNGNLWKGGNFDNPMYGGSSNRPFVCVQVSSP